MCFSWSSQPITSAIHLQEYIHKHGFPKPSSGQQEMYEVLLSNALKF